MKKTLIALVLIGLVSLLGVHSASASYADIVAGQFGTKVSLTYNYATNGTSLLSTTDQYGETTTYSGGRRIFAKDADGNLTIAFIYDGAKLDEEWFEIAGNKHSTWYYTDDGKRDVAYGADGVKVADVVYWQDLIEDGFFGMSSVAKRSYLRGLLGTIDQEAAAEGGSSLQQMLDALTKMYDKGVTNNFTAFQAAYLPNSDGSRGGIFASIITFYNEHNQRGMVIETTDNTQAPADPLISGVIGQDQLGRYYLEAADGTKYYLTESNIGTHAAGDFSIWLGGDGGVALSLTVMVDGQWVTVTEENAEELGYDLEFNSLTSYLAANLGQTVSLIGNLGNGNVLYVQGVASDVGIENYEDPNYGL